MKRLVVLLLILSIYLSIFAFPAHAAELTDSTWINVFNYSDLAHNFVRSSKYNYVEMPFILTERFSLYSFNLVFVDNTGDLYDSLDYLDFYDGQDDFADVQWEMIGDNVFRVWGNFFNGTLSEDYYSIEFGVPAGTLIDINILSFYASLSPIDSWEIEAYCSITAPNYERTIHYVPTDEVNYRMFDGGTDYVDPALTLDLWCNDWAKYDYIDYIVTLSCYSVTSISCWFDGRAVPIEVSTYDNSYTGSKWFTFVIRVDQRLIDRNFEVDENRDVNGPLVLIEGQVTPDELNVVAVDSVIGSVVSDLGDPNVSFFVKAINYLKGIHTYVSVIYERLVSRSPEADSFAEDVSDKDQELVDLVDQMDSVDRPSVDSVDGDVTDFVSGDDILLASTAFGGVFESSIIVRICSMSLILCLASYVFFGKKG